MLAAFGIGAYISALIKEREVRPPVLLSQRQVMNIFLIMLALAAGFGIAFQAAINSGLATGLGGQPLMAAMISFAVGTVCLFVIAVFQSDWQATGNNIAHQPLWRWLGGLIGAIFVFSSTLLAPKLGIANMVFLMIIGQLSAGMIIDNYGLLQMPVRSVHWWKFMGMGVMCVGLSLFMFGDRWFTK